MDNVLLTSHIAGMSEDAVPKSPFLLMAELDRYLKQVLQIVLLMKKI